MPESAHLLLPDVVTLGQSHAASVEMEEWVTGLLGEPQTEHRQAWSRRHSEVPARDVVAFPAETSAPVSTEEQTVGPSSGRGRQASSVARSPMDRYSQSPREHAGGTRASRKLTWGAAAVRSRLDLHADHGFGNSRPAAGEPGIAGCGERPPPGSELGLQQCSPARFGPVAVAASAEGPLPRAALCLFS